MASVEGLYSTDDKPNQFDPVPVADYVGMITDSSKTEKDGKVITHLTWEVLEGDFKGRKFFTHLNFRNPSDTAVKIAKETWAAIREATGVMSPLDTVEVHNLPVILKVGQRKRDDTGDIENYIKAYKRKGGSPATQQQLPQSGNQNPFPRKR